MITLVVDTEVGATDERRGFPSASRLERLTLCPGSLHAEQSAPPEIASQWAAEGTMLHRVLAGESVAEPLTDDQQWVVDRCRAKEAELVEAFGVDPVHEARELRIWATGFATEWSGQADYLYWDDRGHAVVIDYKTGRGAVTPADENMQMRGLAVLAAQHTGADTVLVALIHPRTGDGATAARYDADDLTAARIQLDAVYGLALSADAPRIAGEKQCRYCAAKSMCPEARTATLAIIPTSIALATNNGQIAAKRIALPAMTGDEYADILPRLALAEKVIEAVREQARAFIESGNTIPGYTIGAGQTRRTITDAQKAFEALTEHLSSEAFVACCSVGLGKLETAVKNTAKDSGVKIDAKKLVAEKLEGLVETKTTRGSLVAVDEADTETSLAA